MADFPLQQLRELLSPTTRTAGIVTRLASANVVEVATASGLMLATAGAALQVGQAVTVQSGIAWPRAVAGAVYAV